MVWGIAIVGIALTVGGIPEGDLPPLWGLALAFANPVIYATWIILQARLAGERPRPADVPAPQVAIPPGDAETAVETQAAGSAPDPSPAAALMTTATALVYAALLLGSGGSISPAAVPIAVWPPLLGLGLVATAIAIQTFYGGVKRDDAGGGRFLFVVDSLGLRGVLPIREIAYGDRLDHVDLALPHPVAEA